MPQATLGTALVLVGFLLATVEPDQPRGLVVRHDQPDSAFLALAESRPWPVGQIRARDATGVVVAEGTLIGSRLVITAAHVVDENVSSVVFRFGSREIRVEAVRFHPEWNGSFEDLNDIALVRLSQPVVGVEPAALCPGIRVGDDIVLVGRGMSGTGLTGPLVDDGRLRAATNRITEVGDLHLAFVFDAPGSPAVTELEGVSGPGDSGGPAFVLGDDGFCLAGVSSAQDSEPTGGRDGRYGVVEYYTSIPAFVDWIREHMREQ